MRANTQKAQRFFRPKSVEPVSDLPVDLDPEISFQNDGKIFSKKRNEFYLADPNVIYSQQNNFFNHKLFEEKKKAKDIFSFFNYAWLRSNHINVRIYKHASNFI